MTHFNNTGRIFPATLNKIGIGNAIEVMVDPEFIFIIDIINICAIISFFKCINVNPSIISPVSITRADKTFHSSFQTLLLTHSIKQQKMYAYVFEVSNGDATTGQSATNYIDTIDDSITMFGSDNGRHNVLVIISDGDAKTGNQYSNNYHDSKNELEDAGVTVIIVAVGTCFNHDSSDIICLIHPVNVQMVFHLVERQRLI